MANVVVVGAQWGDEAKGKIVDYLARDARMVVRYGGGNNAGHSVTIDGVLWKFHLVPSGILNPRVTCVVADGVVIDPVVLVKEIQDLRDRGVDASNLKLSAAAHVIMPYHRLLDTLEENRRGAEKIGTTGRGIGPAYADRAARHGVRMGDLVDPARMAKRLQSAVTEKNELLTKVYGAEPLDADAVIAEFAASADYLRPFVTETAPLIYAAAKQGAVIFEGAQGTLLDLDLGTYPYVTSSHPIAGGACLGTGIGPTMIDGVIGVAKSYTTRVGEGAFPTELLNEIGSAIRERGHEYGTTTGRARRCGWLDSVVLRYSMRVNGLTCLALGHLDVLSGLESVQICAAYRDGAGNILRDMPSDLATRQDLEPVYEELSGWTEELGDVRRFEELPEAARRYVERVQELAETPIATISVGPERDQTIVLNDALLHGMLGRTGRAA
jgi:adenylosuccinate synthase